MKRVTQVIIGFICILVFGRCKQSYTPPVHSSNNSYVVVEGFINNGPDPTLINLSHTYKLDDTSRSVPELNAQLTVEGKDNSSYSLQELGNGQYGAPGLALNSTLQYRLHIRTLAGQEYVSDYVDLKTSPPIDSISWKRSDAGLQIYANTHDPQNSSHYYRWDYQETWEFNSAYYATIQYVNHKIVGLFPNPFFTCWQSATSTNILLGSSIKLSSDEIYQAPMVQIPAGSWELGIRYSILVRQYVLTADAFNFWQQLQRNTEQIGSIFGPQPSEIKGNIHSVSNPAELVVGFISAGTMRQQRIFITAKDVPDWHPQSIFDCTLQNIPTDSLDYFLGGFLDNLPIQINGGVMPLYRYDIARSACVDCRLTGTNVKPSFWP
jgi:hypothetical protein